MRHIPAARSVMQLSLRLLVIICVLLTDVSGALAASEDLQFFDYEKLTLQQSLNMKTSVATLSPVAARESPGVITIVTRDEIQNSGARDLIDVLRWVPGFEVGVDVTGVIGIGFRGMWGQEGKILVLVDGQEYNDLGYAGTQIDRIPIEQVERVEIIRGPGSAIYGGNAEIAVINVITRGSQAEGTRAVTRYGHGMYGGDRRALDLHYGGRTDDGMRLSAAGHISQSERSDRRYTDIEGNTFPLHGNSGLKSKDLNLGLEKGGLKGRLIIDEYDTTQIDSFGATQPRPTQVNSYLYLAEVSYALKLGDKWTITPSFNANYQKPYWERDEFFLYDKTFDRYKEGLTAKYDPAENISLLWGTEIQQDRAKVSDDTPVSQLWPGGNRNVGYDNQAYYAQGQFASPLGALVGGGRYEHNSAFKDSFVPRVAWTKLRDKLHLKALYSEAFRTPSIENVRLNTSIRPEHLTTYEIEAGYQFLEEFYASLNFFNTTIRNTIVYHNNPITNVEFYSNDNPTGTRGFELLSRWKGEWGYTDTSYSFYSATQNRIPFYAVPGHSDALLGWPMHKIALNSSVRVGRGFSVNPSGVVLAERYGFTAQDPAGNTLSRRLPTAVIFNLFVNKKDVFIQNLDLGGGVFDLFGSNYGYVQPYNSGHAPLPGPSREFDLRVSYNFK